MLFVSVTNCLYLNVHGRINTGMGVCDMMYIGCSFAITLACIYSAVVLIAHSVAVVDHLKTKL